MAVSDYLQYLATQCLRVFALSVASTAACGPATPESLTPVINDHL